MNITIRRDRVNMVLEAARALDRPQEGPDGRKVYPKFKAPGMTKYALGRTIRSLTAMAAEIDVELKDLVQPYWERQREAEPAAERLSPCLAAEFQKEAKVFWDGEVTVDIRQVKLEDLQLEENYAIPAEVVGALLDVVVVDDKAA